MWSRRFVVFGWGANDAGADRVCRAMHSPASMNRFFCGKGLFVGAALIAACATDAPVAPPDAAPTVAPLSGVVPALRAGDDGVVSAAVPFDETVVVPWYRGHVIVGAATEGARHYVLGHDQVSVLTDDGTPVDRVGGAAAAPSGGWGEIADTSLAVGDGRLAVAYNSRPYLRLRIYTLTATGVAPDPVDVEVHGPPPSLSRTPVLVHGAGTFWVVYDQYTRAGDSSFAVTMRRFRSDGTALDTGPVVLGRSGIFGRIAATFAAGRLVVTWNQGDLGPGSAIQVVRVAGTGQVIDALPVPVAGGAQRLGIVGDEGGLLVTRDGVAQRLSHALAPIGDPVTYAPPSTATTRFGRTSSGFRLVWHDAAALHLRDFPTGAAAEAEVTVAGVRAPESLTIGAGDVTVISHSSDIVGPPAVTRIAADGAVRGEHLLRETQRGDRAPQTTVSEGRVAVQWVREGRTGGMVEVVLDGEGRWRSPPVAVAEATVLAPRAGGFWRVAGTSVQPLDLALAPVGAPIDLGSGAAFHARADGGLVTSFVGGALHGRRMGPTGYLDAAAFLIAGGMPVPLVTAGDGGWLLTWCAPTGLRAMRITAAGAVLDLPPLELPLTGGCSSLTAVHRGADAYTLLWHASSGITTARFAAGAFSVPVVVRDGDGQPLSSSFLVAVDSDEIAILAGGRFARLRADDTQIAGATAHDMVLLHLAFARLGPGHFLTLEEGTWTEGPFTEPRILRREIRLRTGPGTCASNAACSSGHCADGVCCDRACGPDGGDCEACSVAAGAPTDGVCAVLPATAVCRAAAGACDAAETCDGVATACPADALAPPGTACADGIRCTDGDACQDGACVGEPVVCPAPDECHFGSCDEDFGCYAPPVLDGTPCTGGLCQAGVCLSTAPDAGIADAGALDAGALDAGSSDARPVPDAAPAAGSDGGGCQATAGTASPLAVLAVLALLARRRRR
jgi:hypothetical protein